MLEKQADRLDALDDSTDYFEYLKKEDGLDAFIYNLTDDVLGSPEVSASLKSLRITNNIPPKADDLTALRYIVRMNPDSPKVHSLFNKASEEMFKDIDKEIENVSEIKRVVSSDKDPEEFIKYLIDEATSLGIYWSYGDGYAYYADKNHKYRYTFIADVTPDMIDIKKTRLASLTFNRNEQEIRLKEGVPVTLKGLLCDGVSIDIPSELLNKTFISDGVSTMGFTFFGLNKAAKFISKSAPFFKFMEVTAGKKELIQEIRGKKKLTDEQAVEVYKSIVSLIPAELRNDKNCYKYVDFLVHQYLDGNFNPSAPDQQAKASGGANLFLEAVKRSVLPTEKISKLNFADFHNELHKVLGDDTGIEQSLSERVADTDAKLLKSFKDNEKNTYHLFEVPTSKGVDKLFKGSSWCIRDSDTAEDYLERGKAIDGEDHPFFLLMKNGSPYLLHYNLDFREKHDMIPTDQDSKLFDYCISKTNLPTDYKIRHQLPLNKEEVENLSIDNISDSYRLSYIADEYAKAGKELPEDFFNNWNGSMAYNLVKYFLKTKGKVPDFVWENWDSWEKDYEVGSILSTYIQSGNVDEIPDHLLNREHYYSDSILTYLQSGLKVPESIWKNWSECDADSGIEVIKWSIDPKHQNKINKIGINLREKIEKYYPGGDVAILAADNAYHFLDDEKRTIMLTEALKNSDSAFVLLRERVVTKEDGELFWDVVKSACKKYSQAYNLLKYGIITKEDGDIFKYVFKEACKHTSGAYALLADHIITKEDGDIFWDVVKTECEDAETAYTLLHHDIITREDGDIFWYAVKSACKKNSTAYDLLMQRIITKEDGDIFWNTVKSLCTHYHSAFALLHERVITREDGDIFFDVVKLACENASRADDLLADHIVTKEDGDIFFDVVKLACKDAYRAYDLLRYHRIKREDGDVFRYAVKLACENASRAYDLIMQRIITKEDGDIFWDVVKQKCEDAETAYTLLHRDIITREDGDIFWYAVKSACEKNSRAYALLADHIVTKEDGKLFWDVVKSLGNYSTMVLTERIITKEDGDIFWYVVKSLCKNPYERDYIRNKGIITQEELDNILNGSEKVKDTTSTENKKDNKQEKQQQVEQEMQEKTKPTTETVEQEEQPVQEQQPVNAFFHFNKLNTKADLGIGNFGVDSNSLSPNTHNQSVYYTDDCWSKNDGKQSNTFKPGVDGTGTYALNNINPQVINPGTDNSVFDKLDKAKQFAIQHGNEKHVEPDDAKQIIDTVKWSVATAGFTLNKTARIVKVPNKNKYRILSEKGKSLGEYDSKSQAEKRLKQIEMFKHMDKKATTLYVDFKGQAPEAEDIAWNNAKIVPEDAHRVKPYAVPETQTSCCNIPGMNQSDGGIAKAKESGDLEVEAGESSGNVVQKDINPSVTNKVSGGSFDAARGGRGARANNKFVFYKSAASRVSIIPEKNTDNTATPRNDQTPYNQDGKGCTSYSPEELKAIKDTKDFRNMKPIDTAVPTTFTERLYNVDNEKMVEGTEFGTWDFFITPTNQNLEHDSLTEEEKKETKDSSTNKIY